jgi:hypothetical protein
MVGASSVLMRCVRTPMTHTLEVAASSIMCGEGYLRPHRDLQQHNNKEK